MKTAAEALSSALMALVLRGVTPPCGDPGTATYWTGEDETERLQAQAWSVGCELTQACLGTAIELRATWGVWGGGLDMGDPSQRRLAKRIRSQEKETA